MSGHESSAPRAVDSFLSLLSQTCGNDQSPSPASFPSLLFTTRNSRFASLRSGRGGVSRVPAQDSVHVECMCASQRMCVHQCICVSQYRCVSECRATVVSTKWSQQGRSHVYNTTHTHTHMTCTGASWGSRTTHSRLGSTTLTPPPLTKRLRVVGVVRRRLARRKTSHGILLLDALLLLRLAQSTTVVAEPVVRQRLCKRHRLTLLQLPHGLHSTS